MPTEVVMPQMGESIFEGTITRWFKTVGDPVAKDEPLFEISTDKVDAEIPSPVAGVLTEIKTAAGATVGINTVVAVVSDSGTETVEARVHEAADGSAKPQPAAAVPPNPATPAPLAAESAVSGGTEVVMPQMGESIFEGTITRWLKAVGDAVQKDEPLFEISTDKVDAEIPSPVAGLLSAIKVETGATVAINTVVALIGGSTGAGALASTPSLAQSRSTPPNAPPAPSAAPQPARVEAATGNDAASHDRRLRSSPLVRSIAREHNLDLHQVTGTGSGGRITKEDALKYLSNPTTKTAAAQTSVAAGLGASAPSTLPGTVAALSRMRSIIAERMVESVATSPHVYVVYKIDMTRIARLRDRERARFEQQHGIKLTYMPFIAAAATEALRVHPIVNASLKDGSIHYHVNVNLGIAVALEWGLIVPVVKQAEALDFVAIARTMADLAERARIKKLKPEEAAGSTFTLTNFGVFGGEFGTPIINQPESAILAIGGLKKEAVVLTDAEGNDTIAIRSMQSYCLGFDHRLIDGADAGKFMLTFKKLLEEWNRPIG